MEARCRAGRSTSGGVVPAGIHPGEHAHEMEGGEADAEVVWLAGWRAAKDGSPRLLSYGCDEQEKGVAGDLLDEHGQGELRA
jgi:hypothetical protein